MTIIGRGCGSSKKSGSSFFMNKQCNLIITKMRTKSQNANFQLTRMHFSRMRTARLLSVSPSMHCPGGCVYLVWRGVYLVEGCTWPPGGYLVLGVYLVWGCTWSWGVYLVGMYLVPGVDLVSGGCTWYQGVYQVPGECTWSGGCTWSWGCTCPGIPPCEQNDRQVQKYCPKLCLQVVIITSVSGGSKGAPLVHAPHGPKFS